VSEGACTLDEGAYILEEGAFACGGAHSWREGASSKGRALTLVGFILLRGGTLHGRLRALGKGETITLLSFA
jgi:hypothetical protein